MTVRNLDRKRRAAVKALRKTHGYVTRAENSQPATELIKHAQRVATIAKLATVFFLLAGIVITGSCFLNFQHLTKASDDALTLSQNLKAASLDATSRKQDADAAATASGDAVNISKSNYDGIAPFRYFTPDLFSSLHIAPVSAAQVDSAWQAYSDAKVSNTNDEAAAVTANNNFSNAQAASIGASGESAAAFRTAGRAWSATAYAGIYSALVVLAAFVLAIFLTRSSLKLRVSLTAGGSA